MFRKTKEAPEPKKPNRAIALEFPSGVAGLLHAEQLAKNASFAGYETKIFDNTISGPADVVHLEEWLPERLHGNRYAVAMAQYLDAAKVLEKLLAEVPKENTLVFVAKYVLPFPDDFYTSLGNKQEFLQFLKWSYDMRHRVLELPKMDLYVAYTRQSAEDALDPLKLFAGFWPQTQAVLVEGFEPVQSEVNRAWELIRRIALQTSQISTSF